MLQNFMGRNFAGLYEITGELYEMASSSFIMPFFLSLTAQLPRGILHATSFLFFSVHEEYRCIESSLRYIVVYSFSPHSFIPSIS